MKKFLLLLLCSCNNTYVTVTEWTITRVNDTKNHLSVYHAKPLDGGGLFIKETWFVDEENKFKLGDTIKFMPKN